MSKNKNTTIKKYSKLLKEDADWDYVYLLELEQFKLKRMKKYFIQSNSYFFNESIIKELNICIKLIDIITEKDSYSKNDKLPYINIKNYTRFINKSYENCLSSNLFLEELRQIKALHLYNLIRNYKIYTWWD